MELSSPTSADRSAGVAPPDLPGAARERLLDAAERLFARRGFGATVRAITREAGCNLASVNYYFGGKANLYREVFGRRLRSLREQRIATIRHTLRQAGDGATLELLLEAFIGSFVAPLADGDSGGRWMRLTSRELLDPHLPPGMFMAEIIRPVEDELSEALRRLCPGLDSYDARLATHSLVAQLIHALNLQRFATGSATEAAAAGAELEALKAHVLRFSAAGIRALARGGA